MREVPMIRLRQRGAIALMTALLLIFVLLPFTGLVLDLGHLYIAKSELQNAADAAALAGAKELNHTSGGITAAVDKAISTAAAHNYDLRRPVTITIDNIRLGSCPNAENENAFGRPGDRDPPCPFVSAASVTSDAQATGLTFLEVDTGNPDINTYLMGLFDALFETVSTFGYAVAGHFETMVTPIGVCAIDPSARTAQYTHTNGLKELVELGFRRGVTYNLFQLNPLVSGSSDPYLINPVDAFPNTCDPNHASANFTAPFICTGTSAVLGSGSGKVYTNTGMTASLDSSLNSRFGDYKPPSVCTPSSAPPDVNIKEYNCANNSFPGCKTNPAQTSPIDWMEGGAPNREFVETIQNNPDINLNNKPRYASPPSAPGAGRDGVPFAYAGYGPLWSYNPARQAVPRVPAKPGDPYMAGNAYTPAQANGSAMYNTSDANYFNGNYPTGAVGADFPSSTTPAPYNQSGNANYFKRGTNGRPDRRVLNIVLIDCTVAPVGPNSCAAMQVAGIGRFFMQVKADFSGGPEKRVLDAEFAGLIDPVPASDIRLYR
ncbi:MAG: hypothetical protein AzoDbin1_00393 [Azoarcus sp.]|nr:hypothetical protein [Azoarcus sp.]